MPPRRPTRRAAGRYRPSINRAGSSPSSVAWGCDPPAVSGQDENVRLTVLGHDWTRALRRWPAVVPQLRTELGLDDVVCGHRTATATWHMPLGLCGPPRPRESHISLRRDAADRTPNRRRARPRCSWPHHGLLPFPHLHRQRGCHVLAGPCEQREPRGARYWRPSRRTAHGRPTRRSRAPAAAHSWVLVPPGAVDQGVLLEAAEDAQRVMTAGCLPLCAVLGLRVERGHWSVACD